MPIHRAANVEEQQHLDSVAPLLAQLYVEIAFLGRSPDRGVEIELLGGAGAREFAQAAQRDLDVARAELDFPVEIPEVALVPDLNCPEIAVAVLPDADAFGIVAIGAEGRGAG